MEKKTPVYFKVKDLDLLCYLRFKGFKSLEDPIEDSSGTRWVVFEKSPQLNKAVIAFMSGNLEARLLAEFRNSRSFLLDTTPAKKEEEAKYD